MHFFFLSQPGHKSFSNSLRLCTLEEDIDEFCSEFHMNLYHIVVKGKILSCICGCSAETVVLSLKLVEDEEFF